jgi:hypothetical protein
MTYKSQKNLEELDLLLQFVPPQTLRKKIMEIWFHYLSHNEPHELPEDFKETSEDIYFLLRFLDTVKWDDVSKV